MKSTTCYQESNHNKNLKANKSSIGFLLDKKIQLNKERIINSIKRNSSNEIVVKHKNYKNIFINNELNSSVDSQKLTPIVKTQNNLTSGPGDSQKLLSSHKKSNRRILESLSKRMNKANTLTLKDSSCGGSSLDNNSQSLINKPTLNIKSVINPLQHRKFDKNFFHWTLGHQTWDGVKTSSLRVNIFFAGISVHQQTGVEKYGDAALFSNHSFKRTQPWMKTLNSTKHLTWSCGSSV